MASQLRLGGFCHSAWCPHYAPNEDGPEQSGGAESVRLPHDKLQSLFASERYSSQSPSQVDRILIQNIMIIMALNI